MAYYVMNNSLVYCTFLNATKAFDRIRCCKLFRLLSKHGIPPCIIRVLLCFYASNLVRVAWNGVLSIYFLVTNGVKQGFVLSPVIFSLYIDGLLVSLAKASVCCYVGTFFIKTLAYADDIVLLAPTALAMRKMLQICDEYAAEFSISFNANNSNCLIAAPRRRSYLLNKSVICSFSVGRKLIEFVDFFAHLGHVISSDLDDCRDVANRRRSFIGQSVLCRPVARLLSVGGGGSRSGGWAISWHTRIKPSTRKQLKTSPIF